MRFPDGGSSLDPGTPSGSFPSCSITGDILGDIPPVPSLPPSAPRVPGLLQLPKLSIPQGRRFPTLGTSVWFRKVTRTEGQQGRAMGYPSMSHLTVPQGWFYTESKAAPWHRWSHGSVTCLSPPWGDGGHGHQASEGTQGLGALVTQAGTAPVPGLGVPTVGWGQHKGGQQHWG